MDYHKLTLLIPIENRERLSKISQKAADELVSEGYPSHYASFLRIVGAGDLGNVSLSSGPIAPSFVYGEARAATLPVECMLIGDDMQGYCFAFDRSRMVVIEISPKCEIVNLPSKSFEDFIESMLMLD